MSFLCWIGPGIFPSSPCKVVLDQPRTAYTMWVFVPKSVSAVGLSVIGVFEVDLMFWHLWFMWPMAVDGVSFKCLWIASYVRPGHMIRCPSLTACNNADFVGLNRALCK
jgi:hypothetical protein